MDDRGLCGRGRLISAEGLWPVLLINYGVPIFRAMLSVPRPTTLLEANTNHQIDVAMRDQNCEALRLGLGCQDVHPVERALFACTPSFDPAAMMPRMPRQPRHDAPTDCVHAHKWQHRRFELRFHKQGVADLDCVRQQSPSAFQRARPVARVNAPNALNHRFGSRWRMRGGIQPRPFIGVDIMGKTTPVDPSPLVDIGLAVPDKYDFHAKSTNP